MPHRERWRFAWRLRRCAPRAALPLDATQAEARERIAAERRCSKENIDETLLFGNRKAMQSQSVEVVFGMAFPITPEEHRAIAARVEALPELIVAAAVRTPFGNITRERPARHGDLWALLPRGMKSDDPDVTHGFMTSRGRFVDRREAARLVVETGQGSPRTYDGYVPALFSEDMWLDLFEIDAALAPSPTPQG